MLALGIAAITTAPAKTIAKVTFSALARATALARVLFLAGRRNVGLAFALATAQTKVLCLAGRRITGTAGFSQFGALNSVCGSGSGVRPVLRLF